MRLCIQNTSIKSVADYNLLLLFLLFGRFLVSSFETILKVDPTFLETEFERIHAQFFEDKY